MNSSSQRQSQLNSLGSIHLNAQLLLRCGQYDQARYQEVVDGLIQIAAAINISQEALEENALNLYNEMTTLPAR